MAFLASLAQRSLSIFQVFHNAHPKQRCGVLSSSGEMILPPGRLSLPSEFDSKRQVIACDKRLCDRDMPIS
jgi:hypothetical protein